MAESNSLDFDDLIVRTIDLLERDKATREKYQQRFEYVLVDEYQDVNAAQYRLVALLAAHHGNITVVGDDDQSIYSWRGSDYRMILRFEEDFPGAKIFKLEENYRSTQRILDAANALVANNHTRAPKKLFTRAARASRSRVYPAATERDEARYVVEKVKSWCATAPPTAISSCCIAPTRSRAFLKRRCSPKAFRTASSAASDFTRAPKSKTSSPICATSSIRPTRWRSSESSTCRAAASASRRWRRWCSRPTPRAFRSARRSSISELLRTAVPKKLKELERFAELIAEFRKRAESVERRRSAGRGHGRSGYVRELQSEDTHDARARLENLHELVGVAREYEANDDEPSLAGFLANIALISDLDALDEDASYVTLMTLHSAKGLEFASVFMTGFEEGVFPHSRALTEPRRTRRRTPPGLRRRHPRDGSAVPHLCVPPRALRQHVRVSEVALPRRDSGARGARER